MSVNRVILIGHLGSDPELLSQEPQAKTRLIVATSESWTDKQGKKQEHTEQHSVIARGKTAETCARLLKKGRQVYIEGRIHRSEIIAEVVQFI